MPSLLRERLRCKRGIPPQVALFFCVLIQLHLTFVNDIYHRWSIISKANWRRLFWLSGTTALRADRLLSSTDANLQLRQHRHRISAGSGLRPAPTAANGLAGNPYTFEGI